MEFGIVKGEKKMYNTKAIQIPPGAISQITIGFYVTNY